MIGAGMGAGAAVRPFYNRGGVVVPITRTLLSATMQTLPPISTDIIVSVGATETLLCAPVYSGADSGAFAQVTLNGNPLTQDAGLVWGSVPDFGTEIWSLGMNGTAVVAGTLTVDFTASGISPSFLGIIVVSVTGLLQPASFDKSATNAPAAPTGSPDSGLTAVITKPREFVWGIIGSEGRAADTLGTWQAGLSAGTRVSTAAVGLDVKEGFRITTVAAQQRAQITGATSRWCGAACATYREP